MEGKELVRHGGVDAHDGTRVDHSEALYKAVSNNDAAGLQRLLWQGACPDMHYEDDHNISSKYILHIACGKGSADCVKVLLEAGAMADCQDSWGQIPLHYCFCMQILDCASIILNHVGPQVATALVNNQDCFGKSCLHAAAEQGDVEGIHLLLQYGAEVNIRNFDGMTPLMVCAENSRRDRSMEAMGVLIHAGAEVDLVDFRSKRSALQRAAMLRNVKAVEMLLSSGAQVDMLDITRRTALTNLLWDHVRPTKGSGQLDVDVMTVVVMLMQGGADLNLAVCEYSNPLFTAAFLQATPLLRFFLDHGAHPNVTFSSGVTPLLVATSKKDLDCVKTLLSYNCCMTTKGKIFRRRLDTEFTFDPIEMALDDRSYHLVQLFLAAGYNASNICSQLQEKLLSDGASMDVHLHQWLTQRLSSPPTLGELVVYSLRQLLDQRLHRAVPALPLPSRIRDCILLKDLLKVD